jgi:hypothetical protein
MMHDDDDDDDDDKDNYHDDFEIEPSKVVLAT